VLVAAVAMLTAPNILLTVLLLLRVSFTLYITVDKSVATVIVVPFFCPRLMVPAPFFNVIHAVALSRISTKKSDLR